MGPVVEEARRLDMMPDFANAGWARAGWGGRLMLGVMLVEDGLWHDWEGGIARGTGYCALVGRRRRRRW